MQGSKENNSEGKEIIIWFNGSKHDSSFKLTIYSDINTVSRLMTRIAHYWKVTSQSQISKFRLYKENGLDLDDLDLPHLQDKDILFFTDKNEHFALSNRYNIYIFVKWIKSGGYGQVYLAQHAITNKYYAIKQVTTDPTEFDDLFKVSRENNYLDMFTHTNIIRSYGSFYYENKLYSIMDYAEGGEWNSFVEEKGPLPEEEAKRIFKQIYDGVYYMHNKNIIHRDLKPNNILFLDKEHKHVVIIDFGICGVSNGNAREVIKAGTTWFLPPEIASGKIYESSSKDDVWCWGVILYYILYKVLPFTGKNESEIIEKILYTEPNYNLNRINTKLSDNCMICLMKMLEKNPRFRLEMTDKTFADWFDNDPTDKREIRKECVQSIKFCSPQRKPKQNFTISKSPKADYDVVITPFNYMKNWCNKRGSPLRSNKESNNIMNNNNNININKNSQYSKSPPNRNFIYSDKNIKRGSAFFRSPIKYIKSMKYNNNIYNILKLGNDMDKNKSSGNRGSYSGAVGLKSKK